MSGGKGGTADGFGIVAAAAAVLVAGGIAAYENAHMAAELEKMIRQEKVRHNQVLAEYRKNSQAAYDRYQLRLQELQEQEREEWPSNLIAESVAGPLAEAEAAARARSRSLVRVTVNRRRESGLGELFCQITKTAEPLVTTVWSGQEMAKSIVAEAEEVLNKENWSDDLKHRELEWLMKELARLSSDSGPKIREAESLRAEYRAWTAKVNLLNRAMERPMVLARPFCLQTAEQEIRRMHTQCGDLEKALDLMLRGGMCEGNPKEKRREVASRIHSVMEQLGLAFLGRSEQENRESSYYSFHNSAIKCMVTDQGRVAFDCVGTAGQTKAEVAAVMEQFHDFYYEKMAPALEKAGAGIHLFMEAAPSEDIVRFLSEGEIAQAADGAQRRIRGENLTERAMDLD